jgi:hypothetical protein
MWFLFEFWFLDRWIGMNEQWDEQSVRANVISEMRYIRFLRMNLCERFFLNKYLQNTTQKAFLTVFYKWSLAKSSAKVSLMVFYKKLLTKPSAKSFSNDFF